MPATDVRTYIAVPFASLAFLLMLAGWTGRPDAYVPSLEMAGSALVVIVWPARTRSGQE